MRTTPGQTRIEVLISQRRRINDRLRQVQNVQGRDSDQVLRKRQGDRSAKLRRQTMRREGDPRDRRFGRRQQRQPAGKNPRRKRPTENLRTREIGRFGVVKTLNMTYSKNEYVMFMRKRCVCLPYRKLLKSIPYKIPK